MLNIDMPKKSDDDGHLVLSKNDFNTLKSAVAMIRQANESNDDLDIEEYLNEGVKVSDGQTTFASLKMKGLIKLANILDIELPTKKENGKLIISKQDMKKLQIFIGSLG